MSTSLTPAVANALTGPDSDIFEPWVSAQLSAGTMRRDLIDEEDLRSESRDFLRLLSTAAAAGARVDPADPHWSAVRSFLADLSRSRAQRGFSPSETATFVLSLKQPLFDHVRTATPDAEQLSAELWSATTALSAARGGGTPDAAATATAVVLLIDDNHGARYAARRTLEHAGFTVVEAASGEAAMASLQPPPDILVVDVHLPDTNGHELSRRIRGAVHGPLPILQISATSIDPRAQVAGLEGGADAYLPGPTDPDLLVATVRALLRAARAEENAEVRAIQWQATFDSISDGVILLSGDRRVVRLNRAAEGILGTSAEQCHGCGMRDLLELPDLDDPRLYESPERVAFEATTGRRWLRLTFDPMTGVEGARDGTVVTLEDITARKETELALETALQRQQDISNELARVSVAEQAFRQLLEAVVNEMPVGVIVADAPSGRILISNAEMDRIVRGGFDRSESITEGRAYRGFHEDGRAYRPEEWPLARAALTGETVREEELEIDAADGNRVTISVSSMPIRSDDGAIIAAVATVNDITSRRESEHLRDAFIGVLSHELRTPITSIYGGSKVLLREDGEVSGQVRREILQDLADESERLNRMVENLLVLARVERGVALSGQEPVLLQRLLPRIVADESRQWPDLELRLVVPDAIPTVAGDESYIDQVLRNLISNAGKYGPARGTVTIEVRPADTDGFVEVAVQDEGDGIDADEAGRLFELFFRSERAANKTAGSGIGLFVSRNLVEGMGGRMWATPREGRGSEFGFSLPTYDVG